MIFEQRQAHAVAARSAREAVWLERYFEGRKVYKAALFDQLAAAVTTGPVLELNNGFGAFGLDLLQRTRCALHSECPHAEGRRFYTNKVAARSLRGSFHPFTRCGTSWPFSPGTFELAYSVNRLHEWDAPAEILEEVWSLLRPDGAFVINDLKRDADPFITEYVIREMARGENSEDRFHLEVFLRSLRAAFTADELRALVEESPFERVAVDASEPMTVTAWLHVTRG